MLFTLFVLLFSIASVLSQLWLGSGPNSLTSDQLENILHYNEGGLSPEQIHEAFRSSLATLDDPDYKVRLLNNKRMNSMQKKERIFFLLEMQV